MSTLLRADPVTLNDARVRGSRSASQSTQPAPGHLKAEDAVILAVILVIYLILSVFRIDHQSLWLDEVLSLGTADPQTDFFALDLWFDAHGPLFFALLHFWGKLGTDEVTLRSLSVLAGGFSILLAYLLGLRLFDRRTARIGVILFATSPFLIWYSQEVRYISLMVATSLLSMYAYHRAIFSNSCRWWVIYGFSVVLAVAAFVSNIFLFGMQILGLVFQRINRRAVKRGLVCQMLVLGLFAWWANGGDLRRVRGYWEGLLVELAPNNGPLFSADDGRGLSSGGKREFTLAALPYTFFAFSVGYSLGPSIRDLQMSRSLANLAPHAPLVLLLAILFGGLLLSGLVSLWRHRDKAMFLALWVAVPVAGTLGLSALTDMSYNVRYAAMAFGAFIFILAAGIGASKRLVVQITLLGSLLLVNGFSLANYYFDPRYFREDARSAAQYLESVGRPGDVILIVGSPVALQHYYEGNAKIVKSGNLEDSEESLEESLRVLGGNYERIWLVEIRHWQKDPKMKVREALKQLYPVHDHRQFPGVEIWSYASSNSAVLNRARSN